MTLTVNCRPGCWRACVGSRAHRQTRRSAREVRRHRAAKRRVLAHYALTVKTVTVRRKAFTIRVGASNVCAPEVEVLWSKAAEKAQAGLFSHSHHHVRVVWVGLVSLQR